MQDAPSILEIDLGALAQNYTLLKSKTNANVAGIIKANAYGLGVERVFQTLHDQGCKIFFVATLDEGIELRALNASIRIYILNGYFEGAEETYKAHNLTPVIGSLETLERSKANNQNCILHFDTGMNRLGFDTDETHYLLKHKDTILKGLNIDYILSHFACADEDGHDLNHTQCEKFSDIVAHFPDTPKSLCNSSGLFQFSDHHYDLVRPGYAFYGGNPTPEKPNPMNPVVTLKSRILQIRHAGKDESTGYGASYHFNQKTPLATLSLGYADGFLRSGSNTVTLYYKGIACPVVGRVSMDLVTISLENITEDLPKAGEPIEILGSHQSIDNLAQDTSTIGYEILTSLSRRAKRVYL